MVIHSFDGVLRQGRTMHSFELPFSRKRVGLPRPVPYISGAYFVVAALALLLVNKVVGLVSMLSSVLGALSGGDAALAANVTYFVVVPVALAWLSMNVDVDGRAPHRWVVSFARFVRRDKRKHCGVSVRAAGDRVAYRGKVRFTWDLAAPRLQHGFVRGGRVSTTVPARFTHAIRHRHPVVRPGGDEAVSGYEVPGKVEVRP